MWCHLLLVVLSRPMICAISLRSARLVVTTWRSHPHNPMCDELASFEKKLSSRTLKSGIVGLVNHHGGVCAIATFEAPPEMSKKRVLLCDVACGDLESGSVLMQIVTRTPGVGCDENLPNRWHIAHAFYSDSE